MSLWASFRTAPDDGAASPTERVSQSSGHPAFHAHGRLGTRHSSAREYSKAKENIPLFLQKEIRRQGIWTCNKILSQRRKLLTDLNVPNLVNWYHSLTSLTDI